MQEPAPRPPRFPYVAALLCAACVGAAVWTWMRYPYAWEMTVRELHKRNTPEAGSGWLLSGDVGRYVRVSGFYGGPGKHGPPFLTETPNKYLGVTLYESLDEHPGGRRISVVGRVDMYASSSVGVDSEASRFHGVSIAGLVVGAMGVFVFAAALRHWLREVKG